MKCPKCHLENTSDSRFCKNCATPLPPPEEISAFQTETLKSPIKELATGSTFSGRYQIIEELGKGGMGKVYKVFDTEIKEKVALKLLKPDIAADSETIERFRNELKFARKIRHKNVCQMFDLAKDEGSYYITMEYVHGEDLKRLIRKMGQLSAGQAILIARQVGEGLSEAHRLGVVHRDLKPQNIMVDEEGNARIMDFGIARSIKAKGITDAGVMIGTPEYMSPEQAEAGEVDKRSDIYSLGVILYEMVTGRVPFEGDTPLSIAMKHKGEKPKDPRELNAQLLPDLSRVILKCMEKEKEKRYQTAEELLSDVSKIEKGMPTTQRIVPPKIPLTSREITVKFKLKKLFAPVLGIVALAVVAIVVLRFLPKKSIAPPPLLTGKPSLAVLYFENISGDKSLDAWKTGLTELLITKLSQSKFINVLSSDRIFGILKKLNLDEAKKYSTEDLIKVANEGGASHTLSGSFMKAGDNIIISLTLQQPHMGQVITSLTVPCNGEAEIFPKLDEFTKEIKSSLNISSDQIASDFDKEVGKITTSSPEAYKYYNEARKYHLKNGYREAIPLYEKAVAIDPEFAMAYRGMSSAYSNLGYASRSMEYIQKAFNLSDRISERERYQIQGQFYTQKERTYERAIEVFNKLLGIYPDDSIGNSYLGLIYGNLEDRDKAIEKYEVSVRTFKSLLDYSNLASEYEFKGLYEKAGQIYKDYLENISDDARIRSYLGQNYLFQGQYDLALKEADRVFLLNPKSTSSFFLKGDIFHLSGKFVEAEKEYLKILEIGDKSYHLGSRWRLATLFVTQGKFRKAIEELKLNMALAEEFKEQSMRVGSEFYTAYIDFRLGNPEKALKGIEAALKGWMELDDLASQRFALPWKGILYLEMRQIGEAQKTAVELKDLIQKGLNKKAMRYSYWLEGMIDLKKANFSKAIESLKKAMSLLSSQAVIVDEHANFYDALAAAYYKAGDLEKAKAEYEKIAALTTGRTAYGDIYAKSFYMLGKIAEQQGQKARAVEHYQKFLDLWKDADPGFPEIGDARQRLAVLK
jgi:tetratricopeptide (TPR) repeat protein/tRNA A-37 threonylcarbamoyl transferase component Bud32